MTAVAPRELAFHLIDDRDMTPVHNKRVNESGAEVPWEHVAKGHQLADGRWVTVTDDELKAANPAATQTIDVVGAVCAEEVALASFDTPYYLVPDKPGTKAYALLREALSRAGRIGIARIVIRTRQHLCALVPDGDVLTLELLRWAHELKPASELEVPGRDLTALGVTDAELALADQLVDTIKMPWAPEEHHDTFREEVLALIARKADGLPLEAAAPPPAPAAEVVDIVQLLKRSVDEARRTRAGAAS